MDAKIILIVDDEYDIASTLDLLFSSEGYHVRIAFNGEEALEALKAAPLPELIMSDIMMPIMNGYQLIQRLKENPKTKYIPILLTSAAPPDYTLFSKTDIIFFTRKPFELDHQICLVEKIIN